MNGLIGWPGVCGAGFGLACWARGRALYGRDPEHDQARATAMPAWKVRALEWWRRHRPARPGRRVLGSSVAGAVALVATGWPVALPVAVFAAWTLPDALGRPGRERAEIARIEAVAAWTEQLRDTLAAAAGLQQAVLATAPLAPVEIRPHVTALASRLGEGQRLPVAVRAFGRDLDEPVADLLVAALAGAGEQPSGRLVDMLTALAAQVRSHATMRTRTVANRARARTSVRVTVTVALSLGVGLMVLNHAYLRPYGTPTGQLVLAAVFGIGTAALVWMNRIAAFKNPPRLLAPAGEPEHPAVAGRSL